MGDDWKNWIVVLRLQAQDVHPPSGGREVILTSLRLGS